ncbi:MAG: DUF1638 domain-containing protein [Pseudomonadota bacterium]
MKNSPVKLIVCATVLEEVRPFLTPDIDILSIESGLHLRPEKLKKALQELIDGADATTEKIIIGFGLCSLAVIGLRAKHSTMIIPRVDDCIGMCLGSQEAYRQELKREPGTFFLSRGWIDAGISILDEFKALEKKYGKKRAEMVMGLMMKHYTRLAYIGMGHPDQKKYREFSRRAAKELHLKYEEIRGTTKLVMQMIHGPWDDAFIVAPPGHPVCLEDFGLIPESHAPPAPAA